MASVSPSRVFRDPCIVAACVLLAAFLLACGGDNARSSIDERLLLLEAEAHALEESLEALHEENETVLREVEALRDENAALLGELAALRQSQAEFIQQQEAAEAAREHEEEVADFEEGQEEQLTVLEEGQTRTEQRLDDQDSRVQDIEVVASQIELVLPALEKWFTGMDKRLALLEGDSINSTLRLATGGGGQAQVINYGAAYGEERSAVLVLPDPLPKGNPPLIVSLHGFGSDSFFHSQYVPFHQRVNRDGFALLLPNGIENSEGQRFWNPTDGSGKAYQDDIAALAALVQEASGEFDVGPVYIFGYSNGGFMAYHMACKGLPDLRAVASLAGTSYIDDATCDGAPPVSVLHVHGTHDEVVLFDGEITEPGVGTDGGPAFYAGAEEMVLRWGRRAGCDWPENLQPHARLDLDEVVPDAETQAFVMESGCADGVDIQLWVGEGSGHAPAYRDAFLDALLDWLLSQN